MSVRCPRARFAGLASHCTQQSRSGSLEGATWFAYTQLVGWGARTAQNCVKGCAKPSDQALPRATGRRLLGGPFDQLVGRRPGPREQGPAISAKGTPSPQRVRWEGGGSEVQRYERMGPPRAIGMVGAGGGGNVKRYKR